MTLDRRKYLRPDERKAVLDHLEDRAIVGRERGHRVPVRDHMLFTVAFASGLRATELATLRVGDLLLRRSEVRLTVQRLKRGRPARDEVCLPTELRRPLADYLGWLANAELSTDPQAPLFPNRTGRPLTRWGIFKRWKLALAGAGLPTDKPLHATRHTAGTMLYRSTRDLRLVQKHLGHARSDTTAIYADVLDEDVQAGVDAMWAGA